MNHDDNNKPDIRPLIEPELEARVVAWVSGEASPFEAAELERLVAERPELGIFKRRIEAVRGLVAEAIRPDQQPLLLSPERRAKLLQALGAPETVPATSVDQALAAERRAQRKNARWMYALAACLVAGLFTMATIPAFQKVRRLEERPTAASAIQSERRAEIHAQEAQKRAVVVGSLQAQRRDETAAFEMRKEKNERLAAAKQPMTINPEEIALPAGDQEIRRRRALLTSGDLAARGPAPKLEVGDKRRSELGTTLMTGIAPASAPVVIGSYTGTSDYSRTNSILAGSGAGTNLKDIGSAATVVTSQFLKDAGAKNAEDLLTYSTATEIGNRSNRSSLQSGESKSWGAVLHAPALNSIAAGNLSNANAAPAVGASGFDGYLPVVAATPPPPSLKREGEKLVSLSPFEVSADSDTGYAATTTLSGTRLATPVGANELKKSAELDDDAKPRSVAPKPAEAASPEVSAAKEPVSTFSLHVSDVSFRLAQAALARGQTPEQGSIRPEEFYNAFDYGDPNPALAEKVSCRIEQAAHPFLQQRNLVRVALKVAASGRDAAQPLRLTVLLDTSGSMEREDRVAIVQRAMGALVSLLGANDRVTVIGFSRQPRLLAESLPGDQAGQVLDLIAHTPAEGGTNLEEALKLGHELARRQFDPAAQNRVVLLTDGAANLGNAQPAQLAAAVGALRQQGIAFDACGVGLEGLDDDMLETLTRQGDGRYYVLNSPEAADRNFAQQLAGAFRPAAQNVKLQVRFNPTRVGHYRLIGFEKHRLREEDFRNDQVDAAELAAEEAAVAVYQVEALPQGEGELGEIYVRFRDTATGNMVERSWPLAYDAQSPAFDRASPSMQLAGSAALFAEILRGGQPDAATGLGELVPFVNRLRSHYANDPRAQAFVTMFDQARRLAGK